MTDWVLWVTLNIFRQLKDAVCMNDGHYNSLVYALYLWCIIITYILLLAHRPPLNAGIILFFKSWNIYKGHECVPWMHCSSNEGQELRIQGKIAHHSLFPPQQTVNAALWWKFLIICPLKTIYSIICRQNARMHFYLKQEGMMNHFSLNP